MKSISSLTKVFALSYQGLVSGVSTALDTFISVCISYYLLSIMLMQVQKLKVLTA